MALIRTRPARRAVATVAAVGSALALSGCSQATVEQWTRWGLPEAASDRAPFIGNLWSGAWIASMVIGVLVWGLIGYAIIRFRRRSHDETPKQTQYHLPMEILQELSECSAFVNERYVSAGEDPPLQLLLQ